MLRAVVPGVFAIEGLKTGRAYLVEGEGRELALVDTSSRGPATRILAAIDEAGRRAEDLRVIVATHYHLDHTGNAEALRERTGAALYVHADDAAYVDGRLPWMRLRGPLGWVDGAKPYALQVDRALRDGDELPFAGGLRVVHAPGHTPGHIALYAPARQALFAGDAIMNTWGLHLPPRASTHDMAEARRSLARLAELSFEVMLPGHGPPVLGRASEKLAAYARAW
jgi:glyoxylase-like metal-dependent hydrolase (beta-lactamase superfamily II)